MRTKTLAEQRHTVAWPAGSCAWCARDPRIETRGSHHIISHPISHQIGFSGSGVRVIEQFWIAFALLRKEIDITMIHYKYARFLNKSQLSLLHCPITMITWHMQSSQKLLIQSSI